MKMTRKQKLHTISLIDAAINRQLARPLTVERAELLRELDAHRASIENR